MFHENLAVNGLHDTTYLPMIQGFRQNYVTTEWKSVTGLARDPPLAAHGIVRVPSGC